MSNQFPVLDPKAIGPTREALHDAARVLGEWLKILRPRRKHWWHASLRPGLDGLTTGVVSAPCDVELFLDLRRSELAAFDAGGVQERSPLDGRSTRELASFVHSFLAERTGHDGPSLADFPATKRTVDAKAARAIGAAIASVAAALEALRAEIREETSPIQHWPHHFDLSMLHLPGKRVAGQDPADEESADHQMNFGFSFGDDNVSEPYFYITAYPRPGWLQAFALPSGASWHAEGFEGVLLTYQALRAQDEPRAALLTLWRRLLEANR